MDGVKVRAIGSTHIYWHKHLSLTRVSLATKSVVKSISEHSLHIIAIPLACESQTL